MTTDLIDRPEDASKGGFQAIKRVEGILQPLKRVASKFESDDPKKIPSDQVEIVLEEATILEMNEGEPMPELNEDRFTTWLNYAPPGKDKSNVNSFFSKGWCAAAIELCKARGIEVVDPKDGETKPGTWRNLINTRICLEQRTVRLFKPKNPEGYRVDEEGYVISTHYVPVECGEEQGDLNDYVRGLIVGLNSVAAKRAVLLDNRAKRYPEFKEAIDAETICEMLGLAIHPDGTYQICGEPEVETKEE